MAIDLHSVRTPEQQLSPRTTLAGKRIVVTGVTGFLGKVWLSHTLTTIPDVGHIFVLARPGSEGAEERWRKIAERSPAMRPVRERHGAGLGAFLADKVTAVASDCGEPLCGLDGEDIAGLGRIDMVIHFAGLTDFVPDPVDALKTNVNGAIYVADLADALGAPMLHTSTCFVAGDGSRAVAEKIVSNVGPNGVEFDVDTEIATLTAICENVEDRKERIEAVTDQAKALGWPNIYTFTKALAEAALAKRELPTSVLRPAIVECAQSFPFRGWNEGINTTGPLVWLLKGWFRHFPAARDHRYDVIPVDDVVRATTLVTTALLEGVAEECYQIGTSGSNPISFGRGVELNNLAIRRAMRSGDAKKSERFFFRFWDTKTVGFDQEHFMSVPKLRKRAKWLQRTLEGVPVKSILPRRLKGLTPQIEGAVDNMGFLLAHTDKSLNRLQKMLELYRPFIHDNDWLFVNDHIRGLDLALVEEERGIFGWRGDTIDWRDYWLTSLYPGLNTWCIPLLEGGDVPQDPPLAQPLDLTPKASRQTKAVS